MKDKNMLVIVDDPRVSRLICHVAKEFNMSCLAVNKTDDINTAYIKSMPDVILLDPEPLTGQENNVLNTLSEHQTDAVIVITHPKYGDIHQMEELGESLGLNIVGVLPDVFDVEELKHKFLSIIKGAGKNFVIPDEMNGNDEASRLTDRRRTSG